MLRLIALLAVATAAPPQPEQVAAEDRPRALALAASPSVTVPLEDWEKLRKLQERPSLTVVDLVRLEGSFAKRDLAMVLTGRAAGTLPQVDVLDGRYRLYGCEGDAILARSGEGGFALAPLGPRFRVRCRVALDGSDRLEGSTTAAVLEVTSAVTDGELVASDAGEGRGFVVVRRIAGGREDLPPSVAGRYRVTLLPDEARFTYRLEVRNPNRTHRRFELSLREGEHVETVDAPVAWDVEAGRYRFDLPPGESILEVAGRLGGSSFMPPVEASLQYLLLESHPLIRPEVRTEAKRVGVGEVGLPSAYRGAQAFLLEPGAPVEWEAVRLEALKTAGFAVGDLGQVFFLGADGEARGQVDLSVDNQGAPALALPLAGEPTFASVGGDPAFLTRDAGGRLFLPLSQGLQQVSIQDRRPFSSRLGFAVARLDLPQVGVPASRATVELRYPAEWIPLYEELAPASRLHLLTTGEVVLLLALAVALERLLALLGLARRRRLLLAGSVVLAAAFSPPVLTWALALTGLSLLALLGLVLVKRLRGVALAVSLGAAAAGALVLAAVVGGVVDEVGLFPLSASSPASVAKLAESAPADLARSRASIELRQSAGGGYQGLPARIELPPGRSRTYFSREMLPADGPRRVTVVLAAARLVAAVSWATLLAALAIGVALRRDLAAGVRALPPRLRRTAAPEA